ncbi:MAG: hypothetical protein HY711_09580 [Candidatus Melainabacteria bacterium]|nr:hypothetical protein [Candidatus Melainabacteria bacterium]
MLFQVEFLSPFVGMADCLRPSHVGYWYIPALLGTIATIFLAWLLLSPNADPEKILSDPHYGSTFDRVLEFVLHSFALIALGWTAVAVYLICLLFLIQCGISTVTCGLFWDALGCAAALTGTALSLIYAWHRRSSQWRQDHNSKQ